MDYPHELGFLGAGNMAEAIARAAIDQQVLEPSALIAADPAAARRDVFASLGAVVTENNHEVVRQARHLLLAVKPQTLANLQDVLKAIDAQQQVVISIMAGCRTAGIEKIAGKELRLIRVMPNTPLQVGCGMAGVSRGAHARSGDDRLAMQLFEASGAAIRVSEDQLDAVTAVSGSGPAYLFYLAEAMEQAAAALDLAEHGRTLAVQTLLGAATLLAASPKTSAAELRKRVTSPGGTTEAALTHMDDRQVRDAIVDAIKAACQRSRELGS